MSQQYPQKKRLIGALAATALLTGCGASLPGSKASPGPTSFTVSGTITVEAGDGSEATQGGACVTDGGYSDISNGTQVAIKDASSKVLALGNLGPGYTSEILPVSAPGGPVLFESAYKCTFDFSVATVPEGESFYAIEVAHRGELRYERSTLATPLALKLG